MTNNPNDDFSLHDRLAYSGPQTPTPDEELKPYYCTYCLRILLLYRHEIRVCQNPTCIRNAIQDRFDRILEIQLSIPKVQAEVLAERAGILTKIYELEQRSPESLAVQQYRGVLKSIDSNILFWTKNNRVDRILALESQIKQLSKRLWRPSFSDEYRRGLWLRDEGICYLCSVQIYNWYGQSMHIDHVNPRSRGGSDEAQNLRIAHPICNLKKGDRELCARTKAILESLREIDEGGDGFLF